MKNSTDMNKGHVHRLIRMELSRFNRYQLGMVSTYLCTHHRREEFINELANHVVS